MRSRYSAYVLGFSDYLLATWHVSTRPAVLDFAEATPARTNWLGLSLNGYRVIDDSHAEVEFVARYRIGGGRAARLHERSRFVCEGERWFYVGGQFDPAA